MSYSVVEADLEKNRSTIVAIWAANFDGGAELAERRFDWIYLGNPAGAARCWLLRHDASGSYVGAAALFPRRFSYEGRPIRAAIGADYSVLQEHRSLMPALKLQRIVTSEGRSDGTTFLYGFPALHSAPVMTRAGYRKLGVRSLLSKPLTTRNRFGRIRATRPLAGILTPVADLLWHTYWRVRRPSVRRRGITLLLDGFDDRFDRLWASVSAGRMLLGVRDREYLSWRFPTGSAQGPYRIWALLDDAGEELQGYVVFHNIGTRVVVDDILSSDHGDTLTRLTTSFEDMCRDGCQTVAVPYFGNAAVAEALRAQGFREAATNAQAVVSAEKSTLLEPALSGTEHWWLFPGDMDV